MSRCNNDDGSVAPSLALLHTTRPMNVAASILYLVTAALCVGAATRGRATVWATLTGLFVAFAVWRLAGLEETARTAVRALLIARGEYQDRQSFQRPLAAFLIVVFLAVGAFGWLRWRRVPPRSRERAVFWAGTGAAAMIGLIALRLVSLHTTDTLLYSGPHLNRVIDPALAAFVGLQAVLFMRSAGNAAVLR